ncbi:AMP-binding protein [Dactylosporangium aurantiacum]|uniref:AMP-binding protein n=1 Tax=Dactylosporangium aurantiacum TaxID=35754 RepID=A0A9Q9IJZ6_9ACTN|nr:AMP-binding protein [Dactylosporangium aurantiacum]MDG6107410.1 AMP-binding protein [Dactylosporangium aurantiacum]UWZ54463.1 AMP-binding protein [Dactylosporangium aurantiacum]
MTLLHPDARLIDAATGAELSGVPLRDAVHAAVAGYAELTPGVLFLRTPTTVEAIVRYIGAFEAGRPLALLDPGLPAETLADFVERFEPAAVCGPLPSDVHKGYTRRNDELWERDTPSATVAHPDLATLLATSGSTGNPKLVRLSRGAILANTTSIIEALGITGADVAVSSLPFYYSFGMSVLNTHLAAGATVVVESEGLVARSFWPAITKHEVTSLALVPSQYEMLRRLRFDPRRYPSLRTLTQAGGRLRAELVQDFHERMATVGGRLFVMYGQTEAAPRLTTLPADRLAEKLGSVGPAVPGGRLTVRLEDGTETTAPGVVGEVLYRGPNVMMGYAETAADLARGDEQGGLLETGDLGHLDEEGYLFIDGRLKRFGKVFGVRLNLDDIEQLAAATGPGAVAAVAGDDKVIVFVEGATAEDLAPRVNELADRLKLHWSGFEMRGVPALPLLSNGKVDYRALESAR